MQPGEGDGESDSMVRNGPSSLYNPRRGGMGGIQRSRGLVLLVVCVALVAFFVVPRMSGEGHGLRGGGRSAADFSEEGPFVEDQWEILLISDLDKNSKVDDKGKNYRSVLQSGKLAKSPSSGEYSVEFGTKMDLFSGHNEAGRGMELSELIKYRGSLLSVDDRTGIVFEIIDDGEGSRHVAPRYILPEGDGLLDKGMKLEWATQKDGSLIVGSFGKEYTDDNGAVVNTNNNWVIFIDENGVTTRQDWTQQYNKMREVVGASFPGYMIHESGAWSDTLQKWVFMPRRISSEGYDDMKDEKMGSNTILIVDEDFRHVDVKHAGEVNPTHGFSSFKFVPGTGDKVVVALKSEENDAEHTQNTFIMVFTLDGEVLLEETEIPGGLKFEGIEIFPIPESSKAAGEHGGNR